MPGDVNGAKDVFVRDLASNQTTLASVSTAGVRGDGDSYEAHLSATGRYVTFESNASNLVPSDTNGKGDAFVRDLEKGTTTRISVAWNGAQANGDAWYPVISADGRYAAFYSDSTNLIPGVTPPGTYQLYIRDLEFGSTYMASVSPTNIPGNGDSYEPRITPDGTHVVFYSWASNLVPGDTNGVADVFMRDLGSSETTLVSVSSSGVQGDGRCGKAAVSSDGKHVVFESEASNLVNDDTNGKQDVFVRDLASGLTVRLSASSAGAQANNNSERPGVSADGRYVTFSSDASSLVASDTNGKPDVFVLDRAKAGSALTATSVSKTPAQVRRQLQLHRETGLGSHGAPRQASGASAGGQPERALGGHVAERYDGSRRDVLDPGYAELEGALSCSVHRHRMGLCGVDELCRRSDAPCFSRHAEGAVKNGEGPSEGRLWLPEATAFEGDLPGAHLQVAQGLREVEAVRIREGEGSDYKSYTKYSAKVKLTRRGTWRLRAYHPADSGHASGWSAKYDYVRVK